jgi:hypothetical protein
VLSPRKSRISSLPQRSSSALGIWKFTNVKELPGVFGCFLLAHQQFLQPVGSVQEDVDGREGGALIFLRV